MMRLSLFAILVLSPQAAGSQLFVGSAVAVDGDTFTFGTEMIRLHGIDALEAGQVCSRGTEKWRCGDDATRFLQALLDDGTLQCRLVTRDEHDRWVSICEANGQDLGEAIVNAGLAVSLSGTGDPYVETEEHARAQAKGIWAGEFQHPALYRASQPDFVEPRPAEITRVPIARQSSFRELRQSGEIFFRNCREARRAGVAPIRRGQPGYRADLDGDNDGIACEPVRRR